MIPVTNLKLYYHSLLLLMKSESYYRNHDENYLEQFGGSFCPVHKVMFLKIKLAKMNLQKQIEINSSEQLKNPQPMYYLMFLKL